MRANLGPSLKLMFGDEGGYSNRKTDAGGPTKYGVTQATLAAYRGRSVTPDDVKRLSLDEAQAIYVANYWTQAGGDQLPVGLDYAVFDFGVNSGPPTAVKQLQRVLHLKEDGWVGPDTLRAIKSYSGGLVTLIEDYCEQRMRYLRSLKGKQGFSANGRGWTIRVTGIDPKGEWKSAAGVVGNAIKMVHEGPNANLVKQSDPLPAGGDSKAPPAQVSPWLKPDVALPTAGAVATGAATVLTAGVDPVRIAIGIAIIVVIGLGAFYAYQRIKRTA